METNYQLIIAYDGSEFGGWQVQPNAVSIQELIEKALQTILREPITLTGSGRTDAGVHAIGQVANFFTSKTPDPYRLRASLNGLLPKSIRIKEVSTADHNFHARYSAKRKCYHYRLCTAEVQLPFQRPYSWHIRFPFDAAALKQAAHYLIGEHDFTSFANEAHSGSAAKNAVRSLYRLDCIPEDDGWRLEFEANGFLYKMVRNITGTLIEVAAGKRCPNEMSAILEAKDRKEAGQAAPPQGLFLISVSY